MIYTWTIIIVVMLVAYVMLITLTPLVDLLYDVIIGVINDLSSQGLIKSQSQLNTTLNTIDLARTIFKLIPVAIMVGMLIYGINRAMRREPEYAYT